MPPKKPAELTQNWRSFLTDLDKLAPEQISLHCIGGFALTLAYHLPRPTGDIDYLSVKPEHMAEFLQREAGQNSPLHKKHKLYLQSVSGISDYPDTYEDRLVEINVGLHKLRLFVLDPYDLALSKLTRNTPKDREDVKFLADSLKLSYAILKKRFETEMKPWVANADRHGSTLEWLWKEYFQP